VRAVAACAWVQPIVKASVMTFSVGSKSEQISQEIAFVGR
jgi:hypothetical protein